MSGVRLDEACKVKYDEVQKKHMHRYVTFHIKDDKEIVVDKVGLVDWPLNYSLHVFILKPDEIICLEFR